MHIVCDIGATKTRLAGSKNLTSFSEPVILSTPKKYQEAVGQIKKTAEDIARGEEIKMFAAGMRGLDKDQINIRASEKLLSDWAGKPLGTDLETALRVKVLLENDTSVVGLGEAIYGPGKNRNLVVYITISTGVGGTIIQNGKIDDSAFGFEPGHQVIDAGHSLTKDGDNTGFLEDYISGTAVAKRFGKSPKDIDDSAIWDEIARYAAFGVTNSIVHWSPSMIIFGGSMMNEVGIRIDDIKKHLKDKSVMRIFAELPTLEKAHLGDFGGLWGAMEIIKQHKNSQ